MGPPGEGPIVAFLGKNPSPALTWGAPSAGRGTILTAGIPHGPRLPPPRPRHLRAPGGPPEPLSPGRPAFRTAVPDPPPAGQRGGSRSAGPGPHPPLHGPPGRRHLEDPAGPGAGGAGRPRGAGHAVGLHAGRGDALRVARTHGGILRVLHDAGARGRGPEGPGRAVPPVPERGGGLRAGPVREWRDPGRPGLRG